MITAEEQDRTDQGQPPGKALAPAPAKPAPAQLTTQEWRDLAAPLIDTLETAPETGTWLAPAHRMPAATSSLKEKAQLVRVKTEAMLAPAPSKALAGHITLLLQHYYRDANIPPAISEGLAMQWLECLESFPEWAVKAACIDYLKGDTKGRKPSPGQIVALAASQVSKYRALILRCNQIIAAKPPEPRRAPPTAEEKARVAAILAAARIGITKGVENDET